MSGPAQTPPPLTPPAPPPARGLNRIAVGAALVVITLLFAILAFFATSQKPQPPLIKEVRDPKPAAPDFLSNPPRRPPGEAPQVDPRLAQLLSRPPASSVGPFGLQPVPSVAVTPSAAPEGVEPPPAGANPSGEQIENAPPPGTYRPYPGLRITRLDSASSPARPQSWEAAFKSSLLASGTSTPPPAPLGSTPGGPIHPEDLLPLSFKANGVRPGELDSPAPPTKPLPIASKTRSHGQGPVLPAGTVINATLLTAINTQHPGDVGAQVSTDILDSRGRILLSKGSRLLGTYKDQVGLGDSRVAIAWTRLQVRGRMVDLPDLATAAPDGSAGQPGSVNHHTGLVFGRAALLSLISAGAQLGQPRRGRSDVEFSNGEIVAGAATQELTATANEHLKKTLAVTPTIEVPIGTPITVFLPSDLSLPLEE